MSVDAWPYIQAAAVAAAANNDCRRSPELVSLGTCCYWRSLAPLYVWCNILGFLLSGGFEVSGTVLKRQATEMPLLQERHSHVANVAVIYPGFAQCSKTGEQ